MQLLPTSTSVNQRGLGGYIRINPPTILDNPQKLFHTYISVYTIGYIKNIYTHTHIYIYGNIERGGKGALTPPLKLIKL